MLVIGKRFNRSNPHKVGGVIVLFEQFLSDLESNSITHECVDINKNNYPHAIIAFLIISFKIFLGTLKHDHVSFHGSSRDFVLLAPITVFIARLFRKKISLRKFGGTFDVYYENASSVKKMLIRYALTNANVLFFETKYLVDHFRSLNSNTNWFPNVRRKPTFTTKCSFNKMFVFVGHVKHEKGIIEILEVASSLPQDYTVHIYGPEISFQCPPNLKQTFNSVYKGPLKPNEVLTTLSVYDVLLLPSYSEGYPGIIIEALSVGLPTIATSLRGIVEIFQDSNAGILIPPKESEPLRSAILSITPETYLKAREEAIALFQSFDAEIQMKRLLHIIQST